MKSVSNELEKHWLHIVHHNIYIPTHQIITGNDHEDILYTKTTFLSDKIAIENSASQDMLCLHSDNQFSVKEELLEDVTDFVLREIEGVDTFREEGTDMPDVHLNERENVVLPDNLKNILTNSCVIDASCSSSTSTIKVGCW